MIGLMGAMPEEINGIANLIEEQETTTIGNRTFHHGLIYNQPVVVGFSRWGKVASATTASIMIHHFNINELVFTGVAGGISPDVRIGDIVIAKRLLQHDMDARPIFAQFQIPLTEQIDFIPGKSELEKASLACDAFIMHDFSDTFSTDILQEFQIEAPRMHIGTIASGDQFIASDDKRTQLLNEIPDLLAVEMEGAAIAQVCADHQLPFTVIRTISDDANEHAPINFELFIKEIAAKFSLGIVNQMLNDSKECTL